MNQENMKQAYTQQQTQEGQKALQARKTLAEGFSKIINRPIDVPEIGCMYNEKTGKKLFYEKRKVK